MNKKNITTETIINAQRGDIIATGIVANAPEGLFMTNSGGNLRYVAVVGGANDWCVYCHWSHHDVQFIKSQGDKVISRNNLSNILNFDDAVWGMYRL